MWGRDFGLHNTEMPLPHRHTKTDFVNTYQSIKSAAGYAKAYTEMSLPVGATNWNFA